MKSKEFDDQIRASFEKASLPYNHENWQKLSATLDEKKGSRSKRFLLWPLAAVAASVAMAIGIATWVNHEHTNTIAAKKSQLDSVSPVTTANVSEQANVAQLSEHTALPVTIAQRQQSFPVQKISGNIAQAPTINTPLVLDQAQTLPVVAETAVTTQTVNEQAGTFKAEAQKEPVVAKKDKPVHPFAAITKGDTYYEDMSPVRSGKKQFITMSGGLNYGSLNSGYVMGFSAGTRLNDKFYVEGDVAFVGNIAGEKTKHTFVSKSSALGKTTSSYTTTTTTTIQRFYNLYYAQVTPTLGYRVRPNLSVGVGADVQRLLMDDVLVTETDDPDDARQLPGLDMGLVGKTEYALSKEIKASVYYRKAMNQPLTGNNKLLDRDYLQLQLKFTIFNR